MKFVNSSMGPVLNVPDPEKPWEGRLITNPFPGNVSLPSSFEEYIRGHYYDTYLEEIRRLIADGRLPVGKVSKVIPEPDDVFVNEICILKIQFGMDEMVFDPVKDVHTEYPPGYPFIVRMQACIKASITLNESWDLSCQTDIVTQWYQVDGYVVFYPDHQDFHPVESAAIYDKDAPPLDNPLSETLVPYIGKVSLDKVAYRILSSFYQEALEKPARVKAKLLAGRLRLNIRNMKLSKDCSRFGLLVMRDCWILVDGEPVFVRARTILVDREACRKKRGGRTSWVIFHECIHYILHRAFYEAQRLYNAELACLCCGIDTHLDKDNDLYWLEWQAEHLPAHLMIPVFTAPAFIREELLTLRRRFPDADEEALREKLIPVVADRFSASKQCTKIRLEELGFESCLSQPDSPLKMVAEEKAPYARHSSLRYTVSLGEVPGNDRTLKAALESGIYVYADSRFCINSPGYVTNKNGAVHLTPYALSHEEECCIPFRERKRYSGYDPSGFHMDEITGTVIVCGSTAETRKKTLDQVFPGMMKTIADLPGSVGGTLAAHMERLGVTVEDLEALSHVSDRTIKDIRSNRCGSLELSFFVAICLGLKLEPPYSLDLIRKTRYQFDASPEGTMYLLLITTMYYAGVDACNEKLIENGFKPLTRKARSGIC